jgi:hypothetical protein
VLPWYLHRLVIETPDVAEHVMHVLDRNRRETFVPVIYRIVPLAQLVVPGLVSRVQARVGRARTQK